MQAFSEFLKGSTATPDQIEFIELVVQELTLNGVMEADRLFQSPFTDINSQGPGAKGGRPPFSVETMLRIHFMQQWFNLSDPAMEEALYDTPLFREFAGLDWEDNLPDESTILRFRHLLEAHNLSDQILATVNATLRAKGLLLKQGTVVDATLIAAPSSTKNSTGTRDPRCTRPRRATSGTSG
jgi:transposase, IS5 family